MAFYNQFNHQLDYPSQSNAYLPPPLSQFHDPSQPNNLLQPSYTLAMLGFSRTTTQLSSSLKRKSESTGASHDIRGTKKVKRRCSSSASLQHRPPNTTEIVHHRHTSDSAGIASGRSGAQPDGGIPRRSFQWSPDSSNAAPIFSGAAPSLTRDESDHMDSTPVFSPTCSTANTSLTSLSDSHRSDDGYFNEDAHRKYDTREMADHDTEMAVDTKICTYLTSRSAQNIRLICEVLY
jgi:hypothetical protein